jgi:hypothetical protein
VRGQPAALELKAASLDTYDTLSRIVMEGARITCMLSHVVFTYIVMI